MHHTPVINTKLMIPRAAHALKRERLFQSLEAVLGKRLALVIAGAGYGKTTLVSQWLQEKGIPAVWYSLDQYDVDFTSFMRHLAQGLRNLCPDIMKTPQDLMTQDFMEGVGTSRRSREAVLFRFAKQIEDHIREDTLLVFDDYYRARESREITEAMAFMLDRLPLSIHFVIISRHQPVFKTSRLRAMREIVDINEGDLTFKLKEIEGLYRHCLGTPLRGEQLAVLMEKTTGWAASLILFHYALKNRNNEEIDTRLARLKGSTRYIFQYLEENVFEAQSEETKDFMLKTSLLSRLDTGFCDDFLNMDHSGQLLRRLSEHHLLTFPVDEQGNAYYYHHLLRDFLRVKLNDSLPRKSVQHLHLSIARQLEKRGDAYEALTHYLNGRHFDHVVRLLGQMELRLLLEGRLRFLRRCLDQIPVDLKGKSPQIQYLEARLWSLSGDQHQAIRWIKDALQGFQKESHKENIEKCVAELGAYYYYTGNVVEAERLLEQALAEHIENPIIFIQVMTFMVLLSAILGKIDRSDHYHRSAMNRISGYHVEEKALGITTINLAYSFRYFVTGDFAKSQEISQEVLDQAQRRHADMLLPLSYFQTAYNSFYLGRFQEGHDHAIAGLSLAQKKGIQDSQIGWLHLSLGLNFMGLGKPREALEQGNKSLGIFKSQGNRWGMATAHDFLHQVHLASGQDLGRAEQSIREGLDVIRGRELPVTEGILETGLAGILMEKGQYGPVPELLKNARAKLTLATYHRFRIRLLFARCHQSLGRKRSALLSLLAGLKMAENQHYQRFVAQEGEWIVPLLAELHATGRMTEVIETIFRMAKAPIRRRLILLQKGDDAKMGDAAKLILKTLPVPSHPPLTIHLLGKFRVLKGGEEIPEDRCKSAKALMLCKYLASQRSRGLIQKEEMIELLWPEEDFERTRKRFNVAVSTLRKLFEPDIRRGTPSAYIIRRDNALRIHTGDGGTVDVEVFSMELKLAEQYEKSDPERSFGHYLKAEMLYTGPFLAENPYEEWCMAEREQLGERFLCVLRGIMRFLDESGEYPKGIEYAKKYLAQNRHAEDIYRKLMFYYFMTGNIAEVKKTFLTCKRAIAGELDCPLSQKTTRLYRRLIQDR